MPTYGGERLKQYLRQAAARQAAMPSRVEIGIFGEEAITAAMNEWGIPTNIPERPALRKAVASALDNVRAEIVRRVLDQGQTPKGMAGRCTVGRSTRPWRVNAGET